MGTGDIWGKLAEMMYCSCQEEHEFLPCGLQRRCNSSQDGLLPYLRLPGSLFVQGSVEPLCLLVFASLFLQTALMINTLGYSQSLPILSCAKLCESLPGWSERGSLLPASLVLQHLFTRFVPKAGCIFVLSHLSPVAGFSLGVS